MKMSGSDPWELIWGQPYIDSGRLCSAIEQELSQNIPPDTRTRLLIKNAMEALQSYFGTQRFEEWLEQSPAGATIKVIMTENLGEPGFHRWKIILG